MHESNTMWIFRNKIRFDGEDLLAPRPTSKLEGHPMSAVRDCLFNIFAEENIWAQEGRGNRGVEKNTSLRA
jgi:hypothetical protein